MLLVLSNYVDRRGVKTLRYYHEVELLSPSHIDEHNGYRYYHGSGSTRR